MEIPQKLLKLKHPIILALSLLPIILFAPSFLTVLTYFWPLLLSTALFLVSVIFLGKTSAHSAASDSDPVDKAGQVLLDYVSGEPTQLTVDTYKAE
ncbi:PSI-INTERACTING ROOT-CELL ENRICHED 1 [Hibiscus trionum]|uniref:PSI-INTERACTING ROOT-CELL ENRICHED 1 n=1 Tax=Hibiscus trionum TaxID=183268 RepID=A0A9W7MPX8_HIBTR|nr:PSI-INTERACTING ROOT-CELL ENRICHED 1 [Hibiscus trionum]